VKRRLGIAALLFAAAVAVCSPAVAAEELHVTPAKAPFPQRSMVLSVPAGTRLTLARLTVLENGQYVRNLRILPAGAAGQGRFGIVLAIDASNSMRGTPIRAALAAARAFALRLNPGQPLAIIAFNASPKVLLPFTTNAAAIDAALAKQPKLAEGTHIYDAVNKGVAMLRKANINPGTLVVLSDGKDTGSTATLQQAAQAAKLRRARVFTIGLRSPVFDAAALQMLSSAAGGSYTAASANTLSQTYEQLGLRLSREYLLTYRSLARLGTPVHVTVTVRGIDGKAETSYTAPSLDKHASAPFHPSLGYRLWRSPLSMLLVALLASGLIAAGAILILRPREGTLRRRMAEFVSLKPDSEKPEKEQLSPDMFRFAEGPLEGWKWWTRFKEELEIAEIRMPAVQIVLWTLVSTVVVMWLIAVVTGTGLFAVFGLAVPWGVRSYIKRKLRKKREAFAEQLPDNLQVLSSALRSGHSLVGALSVLADESPEPSQSEFRRVIADEQLGVPLEDALTVVVRRMENDDLEQVALVAALQRRTGSSAAEVLDRVTETVRERFELRRMVKGLTAQGRLSRWIVSLLPAGLIVVISLLNPSYLDPLFHTAGGRVLLLVGTLMVVAGSLVIKRIVEIKV
jgi:tight adherence protein B